MLRDGSNPVFKHELPSFNTLQNSQILMSSCLELQMKESLIYWSFQQVFKPSFTGRFLEGDFDTYVVQMRQPHIWGGEPELLMASHVLQ